MKDGWQLPLAALVTVILFAAFKAEPIASAADIAAWVQGVGSLFAIGAAVWIYQKQHVDKKADDEAETRAFVHAVRVEIHHVWAEYKTLVRPSLRAINAGEYYDGIVPMSADILATYNTESVRIGKIDDDALRASIATVYISLINFFNSLHLNNRKVDELELTNITYKDPDRDLVIERRLKALRTFAIGLKDEDNALDDRIEALLKSIDAWLGDHCHGSC